MKLTIAAISDTHGMHRWVDVPEADVLVHCGDITRYGELDELDDIDDWFCTLPHRYKLLVAGNHDFCFEKQPQAALARLHHVTYLQDQAIMIQGIKFYGSPWQPLYMDFAFNLPRRGFEIKARWKMIPVDTDVLITHAAPNGIRDQVAPGENVGCEDLLNAVMQVKPHLHIFGHIHQSAGITRGRPTTFINAASTNEFYSPINRPIIYEYELNSSEHP